MSKELPDVKVEIILPNYNSGNYLTETIKRKEGKKSNL